MEGTNILDLLAAELKLPRHLITSETNIKHLGVTSAQVFGICGRLRQAGYDVNPVDVMASSSVENLEFNLKASGPHRHIRTNGLFCCIPALAVTSSKDVIEMVAKRLASAAKLSVLTKATQVAWEKYLRGEWHEILSSQTSFVSMNTTTGKPVGAILNLDIGQKRQDLSPHISFEIEHDVIEYAIRTFCQPMDGKWLYVTCLFSEASLDTADSSELVNELVEKAVNAAIENGFRGIMCLATHPATTVSHKSLLCVFTIKFVGQPYCQGQLITINHHRCHLPHKVAKWSS